MMNSGTHFQNTIVINNKNFTSGTVRGFSQNVQSSNIEFRNNIIYINQGGSSPKHALYFQVASSEINSNNNVFYFSSTGTNNIDYLGTAGYQTLSSWQTVKGGMLDQNSIVADPLFVDTANGDFTPTNTAIDNIGQLCFSKCRYSW